MKVYLFGNEDVSEDNLAFQTAKKIGPEIDNLEFIFVKPNEDLPFAGEKQVVIMDTVQKINQFKVFDENDLNHFSLVPRTSVHDFDLSFQLKYLKKLNKLGKVIIIGLPQDSKVDYDLLISILRKLVAQDIQGS